MRIHLLDVGSTKYGDCLLVVQAGRRILIDGAHPGDSSLIGRQLKSLLNKEPPFAIDLLVVTHCHSDHIGCLPNLIGQGVLTAKVALVADEKIGWGRTRSGQGPIDELGLSGQQQILFAALLEEDRSDLSDDELADFLQDAGRLEDQYKEMLQTLEANGAKVIRYVGDDDPALRELEEDFGDFGLEILGPTTEHLLRCAEAIKDATGPANDRLFDAISDDADTPQLVNAYRQLCRQVQADALGASDRPGIGAAKNNQSIVLKVKAGGWSALLAGDMQFAKAEVPDLTSLMRTLRQKIKAAGPYDFVKLTHHTSYNAVDASVLGDWPSTKFLAHTGGRIDSSHPDKEVLDLLEGRQNRITFARTDHNGLITVSKTDQVTMQVSRGVLNDFEPNRIQDEPLLPAETNSVQTSEEPVVSHAASHSTDVVEVTLRIPRSVSNVTVTVQVDPEKKKIIPDDKNPPGPNFTNGLLLASGRTLPNLLVVTSWPKLARNIGQQEMMMVADTLKQVSSIRVVDLPATVRTADEAAAIVQQQINQTTEGILILGGYDVVPANRLDPLDSGTRSELTRKGLINKDADRFIVWSDDLYARRAGSSLATLPVSRIPDGRRSDVVFAALQAPSFSPSTRFGVRNIARKFATTIFPQVPGHYAQLQASEVFGPSDIRSDEAKGAVYYMLHGSDQDGTRYWGETQDGDEFEAVTVANIPASAPGSVVFTGCCWGALTVFPSAFQADAQTLLRPRGPEGSIAIAYLKAGVLSFVGCTGTHYSPLDEPFTFYGAPMHDAFWKRIAAGDAPARALFTAKQLYARNIPHGPSDLFSRAIEQKILGQYTCLGLGY